MRNFTPFSIQRFLDSEEEEDASQVEGSINDRQQDALQLTHSDAPPRLIGSDSYNPPDPRFPGPDSLVASRQLLGRSGHGRIASDSQNNNRRATSDAHWSPHRHGWVGNSSQNLQDQEQEENSPVQPFEVPVQRLLFLNSQANDRVELPRRQQQILPITRRSSSRPLPPNPPADISQQRQVASAPSRPLPSNPPRPTSQSRTLRASSSQPLRRTEDFQADRGEPSNEEYEIDYQGNFIRNAQGQRVRYRDSEDDEEQQEREMASLVRHGIFLSAQARATRASSRFAGNTELNARRGPRESASMEFRPSTLMSDRFERRRGHQAILPPMIGDEWAIQRERLGSREHGHRHEAARALDRDDGWALQRNGHVTQQADGRHRRQGARGHSRYHDDLDREATAPELEDLYHEYQPPIPSPSPAPRRIRRTVLGTLDVPAGYHPFNGVPLDLDAVEIHHQFNHANHPEFGVAHPHPSFFGAVGDPGVHRERVVDGNGEIVDGDAPPLYSEFEETVGEHAGGEELPPAYVEVDIRVRVPMGARGSMRTAGVARGRVRTVKKRSNVGKKLWKEIRGLFKDDKKGGESDRESGVIL